MLRLKQNFKNDAKNTFGKSESVLFYYVINFFDFSFEILKLG